MCDVLKLYEKASEALAHLEEDKAHWGDGRQPKSERVWHNGCIARFARSVKERRELLEAIDNLLKGRRKAGYFKLALERIAGKLSAIDTAVQDARHGLDFTLGRAGKPPNIEKENSDGRVTSTVAKPFGDSGPGRHP